MTTTAPEAGTGQQAPVLPAPFDLVAKEVHSMVEATLSDGAAAVGLEMANDDRHVLAGEVSGVQHRIPVSCPGFRGAVLVWADGEVHYDRVAAEWRVLALLASRSAEVRGITASLVEANDQLLALYELSSSSATSFSPEELGTFLVGEARRITDSMASLLIDGSQREYFVGQEELRPALVDGVRLAEGKTRLFRAGELGLPVDAVVAPFEGPSDEVAAGTLAVAASSDSRMTTPKRKLIDAVSSHVGGMVTLASLHESEIRNALLQRDVETAGLLADQIMPKWVPEVDGVEVSARSEFARLASGDFYTYVETGYGLMAAVGDVSGKGLPAALVMTMVSAATTSAAHREPTPDPMAVLSAVNHDVYEYLSEIGLFVTMAVATWDVGEGVLSVANAGHSPVLYVEKGELRQLAACDPPLGVMEELFGVPEAIAMGEGDLLMIGSDGLAEQEDRNGVQLGYDGLERALADYADQPAAGVVADLFTLVETHGAGVAQDDDRTAVVIKRQEVSR